MKNIRSLLSILFEIFWCAPKLFDKLKCEYEMKITKEQKIEARSLAHNTLGVEGRPRVPGWD
jgi:hypothetical protein